MTGRLAAGLLGDAQQPQVHRCGQLCKCQQEVHLMPRSSCNMDGIDLPDWKHTQARLFPEPLVLYFRCDGSLL